MIKKIYIDLDIPEKSLFNLENIKDTTLPQRIVKSLEEVKPDNILIINDKPSILFFHKDNKILNEENGKQKVFRKCWNFAEAPIIIIENESDFEVYNGFEFITQNKSLDVLSKENLNYISILNGDYFKELKTKKENKRINKFLLENIKYTRDELLKEGLEQYKNIANSLIGRIIFIRYLIDKEVYLKKYSKSLTNDDLKEILKDKIKTYELFEYLKNSFNGDWFPIVNDDKNKIYEKDIVNEKHLKSLHKLISGYDYKKGIGSLFDIYDFSIIPIEFISNVYESFIGDNEQKKSGAYYTPTFLVDYILKYTVDDYFEKNPNTYNCKVLDPACGSGIFLVETLRKLVSQFEKIKNRPIKEDELKQLVKDNIFGIDKDENAILISVFSLYLTMLDYQNPKELHKFKFPNLLLSDKNPNPNFFVNDFFDTNAKYNNIFKKKELDFIIGNPPYGRGIAKNNNYINEYLKNNRINISNDDIVQPFMVRIADLSYKYTKISFIVTSKVLYNLQGKEFRTKYFFNKFKINHVLELSSVMEDVFENAKVPVAILFYEKASDEDILNNVIKYVSIKPNPYFKILKILTIAKSDFKKISQSKIINYDYIWKILTYGSYLDFNFIKRLKKLNTINDYILSSNIGITEGDKSIPIIKDYLGMPFVESKYFKPFYIESNNNTWTKNYVERNRNIDVFKAPSLLISKGISKKLELKSGVLKKDSIFTGTITSVKTKSVDTLYGIMGYLNSSFFRYYIIHTASSVCIERPQIHNPEKFSLPYVEKESIIKYSKELEKVSSNLLQSDVSFNSLKQKLDCEILKSLNLTEEEITLISYVNDLIIPWISEKKYEIPFKKLKFKDKLIEDYLNIFINHYSNIYKQSIMYFQANVFWDNYAIGIYFKVLNEKPDEIITWKKEKNIQNFPKISGSHVLENLFIQKDIKGFESEGFYVVKPNEYKNWHKAIGYLDFYEFNDAILKAGKNNWMN